MVLADLLETCKFKQFWEELAKCGDLIITVQGFEDAIRKFVAHVVNITYQTIEVPVLKELLGNVNGKYSEVFHLLWLWPYIFGLHTFIFFQIKF